MATVFWTGNGQAIAQVETATVTAVAAGGTLTATINGKQITYTCTGTDTIATATAAWLPLLAGAGIAEFAESAWSNPTTATVTATAQTPGVPIAGMTGGLVFSAAGGATLGQATTQASSSPSDAGNSKNWLRSGIAAIPQNGDDVVLADNAVPILHNLESLAAVQFGSFTRWQSFTGSVGLPEYNPAGYYEFRPTYLKFTGPPAGTLSMILGQGQGSGPSRERYNVAGQRTALVILASGSAADDFAIRFLGTNASNTLSLLGTSCAVAMLPAEVSSLASAVVNGGGSLALGTGATFSGTLTLDGGSGLLYCAPGTVLAQNGSLVTVGSSGLTYAQVTASDASTVIWNASGTITALDLEKGSGFDKSGDLRAMTVTGGTMDADCVINDPHSTITFTNGIVISGQVRSGPIQSGPGRNWKLA